MTTHSASAGVPAPQKPATPSFVLLTPKEAARLLKVSLSWLAKARMRGDGPPYIKDRPLHPLLRGRADPVDEVAAAHVDQRAVVVSQLGRAEDVLENGTQLRRGLSSSSWNNRPSQYISIHQEE